MTNRRAFSIVPFITLCLFFVSTVIYSQQTASQLFEKALYIEEARGELQEAIELYTQILKQYPDNRYVAAKALFHTGLCYEKLGKNEAQKAYQRIVYEYADQNEIVTEARARLAVLIDVASIEKPNFRRIRVPTKLPFRGSGMLSPDGEQLAFISEGSLWILPVHGKSDPDIAGTPVQLTEPIHAWDVANVSINWSADGKWIGFRVAVPKEDQNAEEELYIVPAEGGTPKRLPITWKDWAMDIFTLRYALSADAKILYFASGSKMQELCIYSMPAQGGEQVPVTDPITREPTLSPDGSKIAYVKRYLSPDGGFEKHQICMKSLNRGESVVVCEVSDKNWLHSPIWSPDGNKIAFLSSGERGGNRHHQIWSVDVSTEAKPGSPVKFELSGQTANLLSGWTKDNKIGILIPTEKKTHLYTVPAKGGKATQLTPSYACMPVWAPDDKRIYFDGDHGGPYASLEYVTAEGGEVTRISVLPKNLQPAFPSEFAVSKDGSTLLFAGFYRYGEAEPPGRLFTISVDGGEVTPIKIADANQPSRAISPEFSPDEDQIAFIAVEEVKEDYNVYNIFVMPATGGEPRRISNYEDQVSRGTIAWSPDGESIAFYGEDKTLRLIPANGGSSRILVSKIGGGIPWSGIAWSPDGKNIAYTAGGDLHVVSRDGKESKKVQTDLDARHLKIDWSNDGKHIAFTAVQGGDPELWLMENFLTEPKARR